MCPSAFAGGANQRLHVVQVTLQRLASQCRERIARAWYTALEAFVAGDVRRLLELARMHGQVAVRGVHEPLEVVEAEGVVHRQRAHDAEPKALVDQAVEAERAVVRALATHRAELARRLAVAPRILGNRTVLSHRASVRSARRR